MEAVRAEPRGERADATTELAVELERRLARVWAHVLRASFRELSRTATSVLAVLRDTGPRRVTDLAAAEAVTQPTMTALVGRLQRQGLVERRPDPSDARAVLVALTAHGREALAAQGRARVAVLSARLDALSAADRDALRAALPALQRLAETTPEPPVR
jgi:DNA-binding MarR family transcriptional regulator